MWQNMASLHFGNIRFLRFQTPSFLAFVLSDHQSKNKVYHMFISQDGRPAAEIPRAVGPRKVWLCCTKRAGYAEFGGKIVFHWVSALSTSIQQWTIARVQVTTKSQYSSGCFADPRANITVETLTLRLPLRNLSYVLSPRSIIAWVHRRCTFL